MAELEEAVAVTEDIREQAAKLGYIVKQKGRIEIGLGSAVCHEYISSGDPWHITSKSVGAATSARCPLVGNSLELPRFTRSQCLSSPRDGKTGESELFELTSSVGYRKLCMPAHRILILLWFKRSAR